VLALTDTAGGQRPNSGTVSRATGIAQKTCQRHLAGTQLLRVDELALWQLSLGVDVAAVVAGTPARLLPEPYRSLVRTGPGTPPSFAVGQRAVDWDALVRAVSALFGEAVAAGAEHLLTETAAAAYAGLAAVRQGLPPSLVSLAQDGTQVRIALREPITLRLVVSVERAAARDGAVRVMAALLRPDTVVAVLGRDALAALGELAPALAAAAEGSSAAVRVQDLHAAGLAGGPEHRDIEASMLSRVTAADRTEVWAVAAKDGG
jgi:hypothetical protein